MLRLKPTNVTPPDDFTFVVPEDGVPIRANVYDNWISKIKDHYRDNGYELPANIVELAENQVCRKLSGEWCIGGGPNSFVNTRFTLDDFLRGTKVLGSFALSSEEVVPQEVAESRALICSRCPVNVRVPGCNSCSGMANAVATAKGARSTKYDHLLQACGVCHCANESQVWLPAEFLAKGVTPEMMETYSEIEECWKYKAINEIDSEPLSS